MAVATLVTWERKRRRREKGVPKGLPKGPFRTKNSMRREFAICSEFRFSTEKCSESLHFVLIYYFFDSIVKAVREGPLGGYLPKTTTIPDFPGKIRYCPEIPPTNFIFSGVEKLTRSSLKGVLNRAHFAHKNGRFAGSFLPLRYRTFISQKKGKLVFKSPSPKPHLNRTGSVFALSAIQSPTNLSEFSRVSLNSPKFHQISEISRKIQDYV